MRKIRPPRSPSKWVLVVAVAVPLLIGLAQTACAQEDSNDQYWLQERARQRLLLEQQRRRPAPRARRPIIYQKPTHLIRKSKPVRGFTRAAPLVPNPAPAGLNPAANSGTGPAVASQAPAIPPKNKDAFTVLVIGDDLAASLAQGLNAAYADRPDVAIIDQARADSGLVRSDYFDWPKAAQKFAAASGHIDMAVVMVGSNDKQPIATPGGTYAPFTAKWRDAYKARINALVADFKSKNIPLVWVGDPIMKEASLSNAMLDLNDIFSDSMEKDGESFVDVWDLFADEDGNFAVYGPNVDGDNAKLRAVDGVNFTPAGARKLAQLVQSQIARQMANKAPRANPAIAGIAPQLAPAAPTENATPVKAAPASPLHGANALRNLIPAPAAPIRPFIPVKPAAGPVVALTAPVIAPGAQLATALPRGIANLGHGGARALKAGAPLTPRPGRADDFTWPPR